MFSILIPTWNNIDYLKLCIESIRRHSTYEHEILIHVNDGSDGTQQWVQEQGLIYSHSARNTGICIAVNQLASMASNKWLVYLNDDMICCPDWDVALLSAINAQPSDLFYLSATVIEPKRTVNPITIVRDFGRNAATFDESRMLDGYLQDYRQDILGLASPVSVVSKRWWHMVGGYSLEFSPGMGSEDDLMMKFWVLGCRHYAVISASRVYHFACKSTGKVRRNHGARTFVSKWGLTQGEFKRRYLARCREKSPGDLLAPENLPRPTLTGRLKRAVYGLSGDFPLGDIRAWNAAPGLHFSGEQHVVPANSAQSDPDAP